MASVYEDIRVIENRGSVPTTVSQPDFDPYFTENELIIQDLLLDEKRYYCTPGYCIKQSCSLRKWMRRTLFNWLRDVCTFRQTDGGVLVHTAQLIDRYLHVVPTDRRQYQLVGATCFFIASKLKETVPVSLKSLVRYTDYSMTEEDIKAKELTVCIALEWDLCSTSAVDFFAPMVEFTEFVPSLKQLIRQAAMGVYIKAFHIEDLSVYLPSSLAVGCILYAINLTVHHDLAKMALRSLTRVHQLLEMEASKVREVFNVLQSCFEPGTIELTKAQIDADNEPDHLDHHSPTIPLAAETLQSKGLSASAILVPLASASPQTCSRHSSAPAAVLASNANGYDLTSFQSSNSFSAGSTSSPVSESELTRSG